MSDQITTTNISNPSSEDLSKRLQKFREWLSVDAGIFVHPALAIINGCINDGTKNAP